MAWPESLTAAQQAQIENYVDQIFRPAMLCLAQAMVQATVTVVPTYLSSPSGASSTMSSPAIDSVAGLLTALSAGDVVPVLNSGLAQAKPLLASKVTSYTTTLNSMLATYFTLAIQEDLSQIVGSPNLLGG